MVFRGPNIDVAGPPNPNPTVTLYARAPVPNQFACNNPATNNAGTTTVLLRGFLSLEPASSPYRWRLRVPNVQAANPALDDFYATVVRGNAFRARCPAAGYLHKMYGIFDYTTTPTDHIVPPYPGTQNLPRERCS
jgi:hypothetical protein